VTATTAATAPSDNMPDNPVQPKLKFLDHCAEESFRGGNFVYTIMPMAEFHVVFNRMRKYKGRGFYLKELKFDARLTPFWKYLFIQHFSAVFAKEWANNLLEKAIKKHCDSKSQEHHQDMVELMHRFKGLEVIGPLISQFIYQPPSKQTYLLHKHFQKKVERDRAVW